MKKNISNTRQLNVSIVSDHYEQFQRMFPQCLSRFVRNAIKLALTDRIFFQTVFFYQG